MRLVVKQGGRTVNEFRFDNGPIYIGRQEKSQIFLHDRVVSRKHAVIVNADEEGPFLCLMFDGCVCVSHSHFLH